MHDFLAVLAFMASAALLTIGVVISWRQSRVSGPYATLPTLPWAVQASVLCVVGLWLLDYALAWWVYGLVLVGSAVLFGGLIYGASRKR